MSDEIKPPALQAMPFTLVPSSFDDATRISSMLAKSQLVPKDYQGKPENVFVAIAWGQELGLPPLQALQNIAVINGRPSIWGDAALAICMARPDFEDIQEEIKGTGEAMKAVCVVKRKGRAPVVREFGITDAKRAGLLGKAGPWTQYPQRMMQMRARGFAIRDCFPDAMRGFHLAEEVQDIEEKDITPVRPAVVMPAEKPAKQQEEIDDAHHDTAIVDAEPFTHGAADDATEQSQPAQQAPLEGEPTITAGAARIIRAKLGTAGIDESAFCKHWGIPKVEALPMAKANSAMEWIKNGGAQ